MEAKDKTKLFKALASAAIATVTFALVQHFFFKPATFDEKLIKVASEFNKNCPIILDSLTRLDNAIVLPNTTFQYNYTIRNTKALDMETLQEKLKPSIINNVKTNPDLKNFRDNKVTMIYSYADSSGKYLFKITVTPANYQN